MPGETTSEERLYIEKYEPWFGSAIYTHARFATPREHTRIERAVVAWLLPASDVGVGRRMTYQAAQLHCKAFVCTLLTASLASHPLLITHHFTHMDGLVTPGPTFTTIHNMFFFKCGNHPDKPNIHYVWKDKWR